MTTSVYFGVTDIDLLALPAIFPPVISSFLPKIRGGGGRAGSGPLMDLSFRVLFHRFQIIFNRMQLTFSVRIGTKSTNAIKYSPGITAVLGDRAHERIK